MSEATPEPNTAAMLAEIAASDGLPARELPLAEARAQYRETFGAAWGDMDMTPRVSVVSLPAQRRSLSGWLYKPASDRPDAPSGAILFLHGGGWTLGDPAAYDGLCRALCTSLNVLVLSLDYRLAPEHKFPAGLKDAFVALEWLAENGGALGFDPSRISVMGDSCGGNLAAALCLMARDKAGPDIHRQILCYPLLDARAGARYPSRDEFGGGDYFLGDADIAWAINHYLGNEEQASLPLVSPLAETDLSGLPEAVVITAGLDPLRDEGNLYAERLAVAGVPVVNQVVPSVVHGFLSFKAAIPAAQETLDTLKERW